MTIRRTPPPQPLRARPLARFLPGALAASLTLLALLALLPLAAPAQSTTPPPPRSAEEQLILEKAVDVLARAYLLRLRSTPNPTAADFRATALALGILQRLAPDDVNLIRLEIEAWSTAGESDEALEATRRLLRLEPDDEVAQLRIALAGIDRLQDADQRLRAYDRLLGARGRAIDPAVRSRLALDAALLARDNGDESAFLDYLTSSTTLDPTNKEAAALFGSYVLNRSDDPMQRVDVLANIILADPLDPSVYENLAFELLRHGAYAGALRAFTLATQIASAGGWRLTPERVFDFALCEWRVFGPVRAVGRINKVLKDTLLAEEERRARIEAQGLDPGPRRDLWLPPELDLLRLSVAIAERQEDGIRRILDSFLAANDAFAEQVRSVQASTPEERRNVRIATQATKLQRLWTLLYAGQRIDEAQQLFDEILAESGQSASPPDAGAPPLGESRETEEPGSPDETAENERDPTEPPPLAEHVLQRFRGWLALHQGDLETAERLLAPLVETDPGARWAMAVLCEKRDDPRGAMLHYARLALDNPRAAIGSAAWYRLVRMREEPLSPPQIALDLDYAILEFAPWLNTLASDPSSFMALHIEHEKGEVDPLGVVRVGVTVRNTTLWPLAVGANRAIPKRILLSPSVRLRGTDASELIYPIVVLIPNRLRLEPTEEITLSAIPSRERFGFILDATPAARASVRWQGIQGFVKEGETEGFHPGSITVTTLSDVVVRANLDGSLSPETLAANITSEHGPDQLRDILLARRLAAEALIDAKQEAQDAEDQRRVARTLMAAILEALPLMDPLERSITLIWLAESGIGLDDEFAEPLRNAIDHTETFPALALLAGFIADPEDPRLQDLVASDDDALSRLAFQSRRRLATRAEPIPATDPDTSP